MSLVVPSSLPSAPSVAVGPTTVSSAVPGAGAMAVVNVNNLLNGKDSRWLQLEVCREFQRNKCTRPDTECKFAHPPANVEVQNGRVTACYDSIKVRCTYYTNILLLHLDRERVASIAWVKFFRAVFKLIISSVPCIVPRRTVAVVYRDLNANEAGKIHNGMWWAESMNSKTRRSTVFSPIFE